MENEIFEAKKIVQLPLKFLSPTLNLGLPFNLNFSSAFPIKINVKISAIYLCQYYRFL